MVQVRVTDTLMQAVGDRIGSHVGDGRYVPWIDLNEDGSIDILDMILFSRSYGDVIDIRTDTLPVYECTWTWAAQADPYDLRVSPDGRYLGDHPPTDQEMRDALTPALKQQLGTFVKEGLDRGVILTLKGYTLTVQNTFLGAHQVRDYTIEHYQTSFVFVLNFDATEPAISSPMAQWVIALIWLYALGIAGIVASFFLKNITTTTSEVSSELALTNASDHDITVTLANGQEITVPAGSTLYFKYSEKSERPADWVGQYMPWIIVGVVTVVGLVVGGPLLARSVERYVYEKEIGK